MIQFLGLEAIVDTLLVDEDLSILFVLGGKTIDLVDTGAVLVIAVFALLIAALGEPVLWQRLASVPGASKINIFPETG